MCLLFRQAVLHVVVEQKATAPLNMQWEVGNGQSVLDGCASRMYSSPYSPGYTSSADHNADSKLHEQTRRPRPDQLCTMVSCAGGQKLLEAYARVQQLRGMPTSAPASISPTLQQTSKVPPDILTSGKPHQQQQASIPLLVSQKHSHS